MSLEIKGKILQILPTQTGMGKKGAWHKQEFILDIGGQYSKKLCLSLWGEELINKYDLEPGLEITAHLDLESREHNGRWYTEARAWKIEWSAQARKWQPGGK